MGSLREIKDRIASVRSTLKITSAMKLVASSKLRKSQKAIESMRPYEEALNGILRSLPAPRPDAVGDGQDGPTAPLSIQGGQAAGVARPAVVVVSSNSSLCGAFNSNVIKKALAVASGLSGQGPASGADKASVDVYCVGRKAAEAFRKAGYFSMGDFSALSGQPSYASAADLAGLLTKRFFDGRYDRVVLVYNHFVSTSHQEVTVEDFLPYDAGSRAQDCPEYDESSYIVEPDAGEVRESLLPQVLSMKFYAAVLDSAAAEHAARTVAMQTATDNASDLLDELTLEYNKGRQQKITSEILDIVGGSLG